MSLFDDWRRQLPNLPGFPPRSADPEPVPRASPRRPELPGRVRDTPLVGRPVGTPYYLPGEPATGPGSSVGGSTGGGAMDFGQFFSDLFAGGQVVAIPTPVDGYREGGSGINANALIGLTVVGGLGYLAWRWWRSR